MVFFNKSAHLSTSFLIAFYAFSLPARLSFTADKTSTKPAKKINFPLTCPVSTAPIVKICMKTAFYAKSKRVRRCLLWKTAKRNPLRKQNPLQNKRMHWIKN